MIEAKQFAILLKLSGLPESEAIIRAERLIEDLTWIDFKVFEAFCTPCFIVRDAEPVPLAEYHFGETKFDVNNATSSRDKRATSIGGSLLNKGSLLSLSKASEIARKLIPSLWLHSEDLKHYLRTPEYHLGTVEEVWWLGRFPTAVEVSVRHAQRPDTDVDWRFRLEGTDVWINLEVTRRAGDVKRFIHGTDFDPKPIVKDKLKKYGPSGSNELNVLGITLFGSLTGRETRAIREWYSSLSPSWQVLNAIILRSLEGMLGSDFEVIAFCEKTRGILRPGLVQEPDDEDRQTITRLEHVLDRQFWPQELRDALPPDL